MMQSSGSLFFYNVSVGGRSPCLLFFNPGFKNIYCKGSKHLQNFPYQVKFAYYEPRNIRFLENFVHLLNG